MGTFPTLPFLLLPQKRVAAILNILADLELPHSTHLVRIINTSISHNSLDLTGEAKNVHLVSKGYGT